MKISPPFACALLEPSVGAGPCEIIDAAFSFTPEVAGADGAGVFLGLGGVLWRWGTEEAAGQAFLDVLEKRGLVCRVGVAGRAFLARLAARQEKPLLVIAAGKERGFLEDLPLARLQLSEVLEGRLSALGLRRVGDFLRLSASQVGLRLGKEGLRLWRLCQGQEDEPLRPLGVPEELCEELEPEEPLERLEQLQAALELLWGRLASRQALAGRWLEELALELAGEQQQVHRKITLRRPLWRIGKRELRGLLEGLEFSVPVERLVLRAEPCPPQAGQAELFDARGAGLPPPVRLPAAENIWQAQPIDSYLPGEFRLVPYLKWVSAAAACSALLPGLWRALRPPAPVKVECRAGRPVKLEASGKVCPSGRVMEACGPWRLESRWWSPDAFSRDYYQVELGGGHLCRLYLDRLRGLWFVDGLAG